MHWIDGGGGIGPAGGQVHGFNDADGCVGGGCGWGWSGATTDNGGKGWKNGQHGYQIE